jgi:hypothetical protein
MAETQDVTDEQLALLLQLSRDFAFQQLAEAGHFLPFGTQALPDGETEYVRLADERTEGTLADFFHLLQRALTERAQQGEIIAAATVVNIMLEDAGAEIDPAFERAIRVHVEAPGYSRAVLAPYRLEPADAQSDKPYLVDGKMVAIEEAPVVFAT